MKHIVRYYHPDMPDTLECVISNDALQTFITVLLSSGYRIIEIV